MPSPPGKYSLPGHQRQHLGGGAAEGGVAGDVAREGRRHEGLPLVGHPLVGADPVHAAEAGLGIVRVAGPGADGDLADVLGKVLVALAGSGALRR